MKQYDRTKRADETADDITSATAVAEEPVAAQSANVPLVNVTVNTKAQEIKDVWEGFGPKPDLNSLLESSIDEIYDPLALPEECMNNHHPRFFFYWTGLPIGVESKKLIEELKRKGYRPSTANEPLPSMWVKTGKPGSRYQFDRIHGALVCEGNVLMWIPREQWQRLHAAEKEKTYEGRLKRQRAEGLIQNDTVQVQPNVSRDYERGGTPLAEIGVHSGQIEAVNPAFIGRE